jgi:hypothetical protein
MKVNKIVCLDFEVFELLSKEKNASLLVNGWARNYYNLGKDEKELKLEVLNKKIIETLDKIKEELKEDDLNKVFNQEVI